MEREREMKKYFLISVAFRLFLLIGYCLSCLWKDLQIFRTWKMSME